MTTSLMPDVLASGLNLGESLARKPPPLHAPAKLWEAPEDCRACTTERSPSPMPSGKPGRDCPRCPRLVAFRQEWRAKEPSWFNAPVPSFGPLERTAAHRRPRPGRARRQPHRAAVHRRLCRRPALRDAEGIRLRPRGVPGAAGRQSRIDRRPHHQRRALRAAGEQADAGGDQHLPGFLETHHRGDAKAARHRHAGPHLARDDGALAGPQAEGGRVQPRRPRADRAARAVPQLSLLALQHQHRRADAGDVSLGVCERARLTLDCSTAYAI